MCSTLAVSLTFVNTSLCKSCVNISFVVHKLVCQEPMSVSSLSSRCLLLHSDVVAASRTCCLLQYPCRISLLPTVAPCLFCCAHVPTRVTVYNVGAMYVVAACYYTNLDCSAHVSCNCIFLLLTSCCCTQLPHSAPYHLKGFGLLPFSEICFSVLSVQLSYACCFAASLCRLGPVAL